jgi:hypothetical protein
MLVLGEGGEVDFATQCFPAAQSSVMVMRERCVVVVDAGVEPAMKE